jgi:hypothetical protein
MHQHDRLEKGSRLFGWIRMTTARVSSRRLWAISTLVLVFAIAISSAGQPPLAQAASPSQGGYTKYVFYLTPFGADGLERVCVNDFVVFNVKAERFLSNKVDYVGPDGAEYTNPPVQVGGVTVEGSVLNTSIGTLTPGSQKTSLRSNPPGSAVFTFLAKKPGLTELNFTGKIFDPLSMLVGKPDRNYLPITLDARVVNCKFTVTTVSIWRVPGEAQLALVALISEAKLEMDQQGRFSGQARVTWTGGASPVGDCSAQVAVGDSQANLVGVMDPFGWLNLDVTFQPASVSLSGNCTNGTFRVTADPLHVSVPSTGGSDTLRQVLQGPETMHGGAHILVLPLVPSSND